MSSYTGVMRTCITAAPKVLLNPLHLHVEKKAAAARLTIGIIGRKNNHGDMRGHRKKFLMEFPNYELTFVEVMLTKYMFKWITAETDGSLSIRKAGA